MTISHECDAFNAVLLAVFGEVTNPVHAINADKTVLLHVTILQTYDMSLLDKIKQC